MDLDLGFKSSDLLVQDHPDLTVLLREREEEWGRLGPWGSGMFLLLPIFPLAFTALVIWVLFGSSLWASRPLLVVLPFFAIAAQIGFVLISLKAVGLIMGRRRAWAEVLAQLESGSPETIGVALRQDPAKKVRAGDLKLLLTDMWVDIQRPGFVWKATKYVGAVGALIFATDWLFEWARSRPTSEAGSLVTSGLVITASVLAGINLWRNRRRQKALKIEGLGEIRGPHAGEVTHQAPPPSR